MGTLLALLAAIGTTLGFVANLYSQVSTRNAVIESERIAIQADTLRASDPALSRQFALAAYRRAPNARSAQSLLESATTPTDTELDVGGTVRQVAFSQDDQVLAAAGTANRVRVWMVDGAGVFTAAGSLTTGASCAIAFDPAAARLLATACAGALTFWDLTNPGQPTRLTVTGTPGTAAGTRLAFNAAGTQLAAGYSDGSLRLWHLASGRLVHPVGQSTQSGAVTSLAFSPDSAALATVAGGTALLWNLRAPSPLAAPIGFDTGVSAGVESSVAFSSRTHALVATDLGSQLSVWDVTNPAQPKLQPQTQSRPDPGSADPAEPLAFSSDGAAIAVAQNNPLTGGTEPVLAIYHPKAGDPATVASVTQDTDKIPLPSSGTVLAAAYSRDDRFLATACADGKVRIWPGDVYGSGIPDVHPRGTSPAASDGRYLAVPGITDRASGYSYSYSYIEIWDITDRLRPVRVSVIPGPWTDAGFLPRSRTLAVEGGSIQTGQVLELWDLTDPRRPVAVSLPGTGADHLIRGTVILLTAASQDGRLLAAMDGYTDELSVWDFGDSKRPTLRYRITANHGTAYQVTRISFDGPNMLDIGESDGTETAWDFSKAGGGRQTATLAPDELGGRFSSQTPAQTCGVTAAVTDNVNIRLLSDGDPRHPTPAAKLVTNAATQPTGQTSLALTDQCLLALVHTSADGDDQIELWNVTDPYHPRKLATMASGGSVDALDVSSDGERLAVSVDVPNDPVLAGKQIKVWSLNDTAAPTLLERFPGDGPLVFYAGHDLLDQSIAGTYSHPLATELIHADPDTAYRALCERTSTSLTQARWTQLLPDIAYQPPCP